jgi:hypothetical protein
MEFAILFAVVVFLVIGVLFITASVNANMRRLILRDQFISEFSEISYCLSMGSANCLLGFRMAMSIDQLNTAQLPVIRWIPPNLILGSAFILIFISVIILYTNKKSSY